MTTKLTINNFDEEVMNTEQQVLIDFYATWCPPCKMLSPIIDEVSEESDGTKVCKVDIDEEPALAQRFGVMSVPTLVLLKGGEVISTLSGFRPKNAVLDMLSIKESV